MLSRANGQTSGLALDSTLSASLGSPSAADSPAAYTVLDQLNRIRRTVEQQAKHTATLAAAASPAPKPRPALTLLHRI
jgi:hypothetical protein